MTVAPTLPGAVTVRVPAKVNLQLAVGAPRADGFHALATVFHAVALHDEVTVATPADELAGQSSRARTPTGVPAGRRQPRRPRRPSRSPSAGRHRRPPSASASDKDIPVAGGMAGGTADAAAALVACDALWGLGLRPRASSLELARRASAATCRSSSSAAPPWARAAASS